MALTVPIVADTSGLIRGLNQGTSGLRKFGKMAALVGGAAALGGLVATLKIGIDEFMGAQKVLAQTGAVLKSTGGAANVTSKQITTMSESLMRLSGVDDEAIQSGQNLLLTFTNIRNETGAGNKIFDQATVAMLDLSVAMGTSLSSSAILVGKALNDPVKGVGALSKAGVQFTASQKETIKALVDSGNVMGAQKIILKELEVQFAGSAKAAGKTLPGQLNILKETFRNTAADLVARFMPAIATAAEKLLGFVRGFAKAPTLSAKIDFVIGKFRELAWSGIQTISDWWQKTKVTFEDNPGNRLKVTITDSGEEQLTAFFEGIKKTLDKKANTLGKSLGKKIVRGIFGGGIEEADKSGDEFVNDLIASVSLSLVSPAFGLGKTFVLAIFEGMKEQFTQSATDNPVRTFVNGLGNSISPVLTEVVKIIAKNKKLFKASFDIILVDPIKEAIASARASLSGLGSEIGGFLQRIGAASGKSKEAAAIRKRLKDEANAREKARLTEAVAMAKTDEDRAIAIRELSDFEANLHADDLDLQVQQQQDKNQQDIQDLIQKFNDGTIVAEEFAAELNNIIGADFGDSLGIAFVAGFKGAIANLVTEIQGIATGMIPGGQATAGSTVAAAQSDVAISETEANQAKEEKYAEAVRQHKRDRAERLERAEAYRRRPGSSAGSRIDPGERAEIHEIMRLWDEKHKPPTRAEFRLAQGGILKRQVFTAGEAGREAVIPLGSSEAMGIMRDALGGGGGNTTYVLNIQAGLGTNPDELGRVIVESIKKFEKRNGQVFAGPQIQATSAGVSTNGGTQTRSLRKN